jgi:hypothetical protein
MFSEESSPAYLALSFQLTLNSQVLHTTATFLSSDVLSRLIIDLGNGLFWRRRRRRCTALIAQIKARVALVTFDQLSVHYSVCN